MHYDGIQLVFGGVIRVEVNGRKILVKYGGKFNDIGRLGDFGDDGGY